MRRTLLIAVLLAAAPARADEALYACKKPAPGTRFTVSLKPGTSLAELAAWVSSFTCKNVVYSAELACRSSRVNVLAPGEMTAVEAYQLFVDALEVMELKVKARGKTLLVLDAIPGKATPAECQTLPDPSYDRFIEKTGETSFKVDRLLVDRLIGDPSVARAVRIVPALEKGKPVGFKLYAIRPESVVANLGFENGDLVRAVNGVELSSPEKAFEAYFTSGGKVMVGLIRRGKPVVMEYVLR